MYRDGAFSCQQSGFMSMNIRSLSRKINNIMGFIRHNAHSVSMKIKTNARQNVKCVRNPTM